VDFLGFKRVTEIVFTVYHYIYQFRITYQFTLKVPVLMPLLECSFWPETEKNSNGQERLEWQMSIPMEFFKTNNVCGLVDFVILPKDHSRVMKTSN